MAGLYILSLFALSGDKNQRLYISRLVLNLIIGFYPSLSSLHPLRAIPVCSTLFIRLRTSGFPMPPPVKQEKNCRKRKQRVPIKKEKTNRYCRRIRVIYDDPYATDYSSDEDNNEILSNGSQPNGSKRVIKEIVVPIKPLKSRRTASNTRLRGEKVETSPSLYPRSRHPNTASMYRGVRPRKTGKFGAEITDPIRGSRVWLGTFDSEEKAAMAYSSKKEEFDWLLDMRKGSRDALHLEDTKPVLGPNNTATQATSLGMQNVNNGTKCEGNNNVVKPVYDEEFQSVLQLLEEPVAPSLFASEFINLENRAIFSDNFFDNLQGDDDSVDASSMESGEAGINQPLPDIPMDDTDLSWIDALWNATEVL